MTGFATLPVKVAGVLLTPIMMPPWFRFTGFENVLAPLSCRRPRPILLMPEAEVPSVMMDEMFSAGEIVVYTAEAASGVRIASMLNVSCPAAIVSVPALMMGVTAALLEVTVIGVVEESVRIPPGVTVGAAMPPLFLIVRLASVLFPTSVRTELPCSVTLLLGLICPWFTFSTSVALFKLMLGFATENGMTTLVATPPEPGLLRFTVPWLNAVPPLYVFALVSVSTPAPDFTSAVTLPPELSWMDEFTTIAGVNV